MAVIGEAFITLLFVLAFLYGVPAVMRWLSERRARSGKRVVEALGFAEEASGWVLPDEATWAEVHDQVTLRRTVPWRGPVVRTGPGDGVGDPVFDRRFSVDWTPSAVPGPDAMVRKALLTCSSHGEVRLDEEGIHLLLPPGADATSVRSAMDRVEALAILLDEERPADLVVAEEPTTLAERGLRYVWREDEARARTLARTHGRAGTHSWQLWWSSLAGDPAAFAEVVFRGEVLDGACVDAMQRLPREVRWQVLVLVGRAWAERLAAVTEWLEHDAGDDAPARAREVLVAWSVAGPAPNTRVAVARLWELAQPAWTPEDVDTVVWTAERLRGEPLDEALRWILSQDSRQAAPALRVLASRFTGIEREQVEGALERMRVVHGGQGALSLVDARGGELAAVPEPSDDEARRAAQARAARQRQRES